MAGNARRALILRRGKQNGVLRKDDIERTNEEDFVFIIYMDILTRYGSFAVDMSERG